MEVYIIARDLLSHICRTVTWVRSVGGVPIILDNASSYPPLLEWYKTNPCQIIKLQRNIGKLSPWVSGAVAKSEGEFYAVTDPDLDFANVPGNVLEVLRTTLQESTAKKVGVSLETIDLPKTDFGYEVASWEQQYWTDCIDGLCNAAIDTTLAVYSHKRPLPLGATTPAIRLARPYTARHLPWYPGTCETEEYRYYLQNADAPGNHWTEKQRLAFGGQPRSTASLLPLVEERNILKEPCKWFGDWTGEYCAEG